MAVVDSGWGEEGEARQLCLERSVISWHHSVHWSSLSISTLQGDKWIWS
jgi:hypothetical protein